MKPPKLKYKPKEEIYPGDRCAVSRCLEKSSVIDDSRRFWPERVPLCERHWVARCKKDG